MEAIKFDNKILVLSMSLILGLTSCHRLLENKYDASGTFEATEVVVSAEANGKIMDFNLGRSTIDRKSVDWLYRQYATISDKIAIAGFAKICPESSSGYQKANCRSSATNRNSEEITKTDSESIQRQCSQPKATRRCQCTSFGARKTA
jgi:hypothetical protein